ncbi:MAG: dephospho-CoA kinase [Pseudomonadota bacterium]
MLRLAVTGGVATGKSSVLAALAARGVPVIDLDQLCRQVLQPGGSILERIRISFGEEFAPGAAFLDRARMRQLITTDADARKRLEAIVHPPVMDLMEARLREVEAAGHDLAAVEVPLLYEAGYRPLFDVVVVAACPRETALGRLMARGGLSRREAEALVATQLPMEEKVARANYVIDTTASSSAVALSVERILQVVLSTSAKAKKSGEEKVGR